MQRRMIPQRARGHVCEGQAERFPRRRSSRTLRYQSHRHPTSRPPPPETVRSRWLRQSGVRRATSRHRVASRRQQVQKPDSGSEPVAEIAPCLPELRMLIQQHGFPSSIAVFVLPPCKVSVRPAFIPDGAPASSDVVVVVVVVIVVAVVVVDVVVVVVVVAAVVVLVAVVVVVVAVVVVVVFSAFSTLAKTSRYPLALLLPGLHQHVLRSCLFLRGCYLPLPS